MRSGAALEGARRRGGEKLNHVVSGKTSKSNLLSTKCHQIMLLNYVFKSISLLEGKFDEFHQSFRHKFPRGEVALFAARILPVFTFPIDFAENPLQRQ